MATYLWYGEENALPWDSYGFCVLRRRVSPAAIIASGANGPLCLSTALTSRTTLASTGFQNADVLELWQVPLGTIVLQVGARVKTAMTNAGTITIGQTDASHTLPSGASSAGFLASFALNAVGRKITLVGDAYGADNYMGVLYVADSSIDIAFTAAVDYDDGVFDFWAVCFKAYES